MLIVTTQYHENYGDRWKPKFGSDYVVARLSWAEAASLGQNGLSKLADDKAAEFEIAYSNPMSREEVIDFNLEDDDWLSWIQRSELEYEGKVVTKVRDFTIDPPAKAA